MPVVEYEIVDGIGVIRLNNPPVNALSQVLREGIKQTIEKAQGDESQALVLICEGRTFIAGADISEFGKPPQSPSLLDMMTALEQSKKIVVAAIHGTALGGGLETALCCHYRCALASAKVGLPEVNLGLLPGAGGTQRAPRLAGVEAALALMTTGKPISAAKALDIQLIEKIVDGDLFQGALAYAKALVADRAALKRVRDIDIDTNFTPQNVFANYRQTFKQRARGQLAPQHIIACVEAAVQLPFEEGLAKERELFLECMQSSQSRALRHLFFAEHEAPKVKGITKQTPTREIKSVAVIGGGTMGCGITMNFVNVGTPVKLLEIDEEALARGLSTINNNYSTSVNKGRLSDEQKNQCLSLVQGTTHFDDLSDCDLVIEAVFENLDLKKDVFAQLDKVCKTAAVLATNTSYQDVNQIAGVTRRPENVIGLHFFSPANVMKLLEVVRADQTAPDVIQTAMKIAKTINKVPVLSRVCYGFIGNRMLHYYAREAQLCLIEGATPEQIDTAMHDWGMAMGPMAVADLAGLDVSYKAREVLTAEQKGDPKTYCIADALVEMGRLGQKSGQGYYRYEPQTRARSVDPVVMEVVAQQAAQQGVTRRDISDEEIQNRLIFALINEGAKVLEEGIAQRSGDIDVVYVNGYGFPAFRGGPMQYADEVGLQKVCDVLCELRDAHGTDYWEPAPLLKKLAQSTQSFADYK